MANCLLGKLMIAYRTLLGFQDDSWANTIENMNPFAEYGQKFWGLLQMIC